MITVKMKTKKLTLIFASILAIFLLTGLGSAALTLDADKTEFNVSHDSDKEISFNLTANESNYTSLNWSDSSSDVGSWKSLPGLDSINNGTTEELSATLNIPQHESGSFTATILVKNASETSELNFTINIKEDPSLSISGSDFEEGENTTTITIKNEGNTDLSGTINTTSSWISLNKDSFSNLAAGNTENVTVELNTSVENLNLGDNTATITATSGNVSASGEVTYYKPYLEDVKNLDNALNIKDFELVLDKGFGDEDDNDFYPLDEVSAEFELENKGNKWDASEDVDVEDMEIEVCLFDMDAGECVMDEEDMELSDDDFDLKDGNDKDMRVSFKIDPEELTEAFMDKYQKDNISLSLSSLRVDDFSVELAKKVQRVKKTGLTFAPEAGSQRLRNVINKGVSEENLYDAVKSAFSAGWHRIKLYFMIGLPTESKEDLEGIVRMSKKVLEMGKEIRKNTDKKMKNIEVQVSVSTFIPKPFTPFQWVSMPPKEKIIEKQNYLRKNLRGRGLKFSWNDPDLSLLEGVIARGNREIAGVIETAWKNGAKFDSWNDHFDPEIWYQAIKENNLKLENLIGARDIDDILPWSHINTGITDKFLKKEYNKSFSEEITEDCRENNCTRCDVCHDLGVKLDIVGTDF